MFVAHCLASFTISVEWRFKSNDGEQFPSSCSALFIDTMEQSSWNRLSAGDVTAQWDVVIAIVTSPVQTTANQGAK